MTDQQRRTCALRIAAVIALLLCLIGTAAADTYVGGLPLSTEQDGTISGGVYMDADNDWWPTSPGPMEVEKTFEEIPNIDDIAWARLYVAVYVGHMQSNYPGTVEIEFDGDGDGAYETELGTEAMNVPFVYLTNGGNDNRAFNGHGTGEPYKMVNDHMTRVTSDYVMWYDVTDDITSQTPAAHVTTAATDGSSIDGRIKVITLVIAYNDGDSDVIYYWVNQGHDAVTYYSDTDTPGEDELGSTEFDLSDVSGTVTSATLMVNHMASSDGYYWWLGEELDRYPSGTGESYSQGTYFGYDIWDVTDLVSTGDTNDLVYDRSCASGGSGEYSGEYYKVPLAILTVQKQTAVAPTAAFSATPLSGSTPLTVSFTDESTGPPTSWKWEYRYNAGSSWGSWTQFSTDQNPTYTFTGIGSYAIKLTATNSLGSSTKVRVSSTSAYITVTAASTDSDLDITSMAPIGGTPFAKETNSVKITVENTGASASPATTLQLDASDGFTGTADVPALESGASTAITIVDTTVRGTDGASLTYTANIDPDGTVTEADETNNGATGTYTVVYNGYKGKRYWEGGSDITSAETYDLNGDLLYSSGDSTYQGGSASGSGGWSSYSVAWTSSNLPVPTGATVKAARLYVPYTWDNIDQIPANFHLSFNGNDITSSYKDHYQDRSNFGGYADHDYGLLTYDVTSLFNADGNTASLSKDDAATKAAMYGLTLAVVYQSSDDPRRQIFLNEEFDLLGASATDYGTSEEEATAYVPFTGLTITPADVDSVKLVTFVPSGNEYEGDLLFNGETIAENVWHYGSASGTQVAIDTRDVTVYLTGSDNIAGIRSTDGASTCMAAAQQFLVVTYKDEELTGIDLTVTAISPNVDVGNYLFASESNVLSVTVKNVGTVAAEASTVSITDGTSTGTAAVSALAAGASTTVTVTDPALNAGGNTATITASADSEGVIGEDDETNNTMTVSLPVYNNGNKGKRYTGGSDMTAQATFEGKVDVIYSAGNTSYNSASWTAKTYNWTSADLPLPDGATVTSARLYQAYTWSYLSVDPAWSMTFNGNTVTPDATYKDQKGYGGYNLPQGLYVYDVTDAFSTTGNTMTITPESGNNYAIYGAYLVVVYTDSTLESEQKIWINDECDILYAGTSWSVTSDEATTYAPFTGVSTADLTSAKAIAITASASDSGKSKFFFNDNEYTGFSSDYLTKPQIGFSVYDVTSAIQSGENTARIQSYLSGTSGDNMYAQNVILVVGMTPLTADFSATPVEGDYPLAVQFTDESTGSVSAWSWDFNGDGVEDSTAKNPSMQYLAQGTYTVKLTVTGTGGGTDSEEKTGYITVKEPQPVIDFTGTPESGTKPLTVAFSGTNTGGQVDRWAWDFGDGYTAETQTVSHTYSSEGTYTVILTATGPDYTVTKTRTGYITVGEPTIEVNILSPSLDFGTMAAGTDETGSAGVSVTANGGSGWIVTAESTNGGKMTTSDSSSSLKNVIQIANGNGEFQGMDTSMTFMSGSSGEDRTDTASIQQTIDSSDAAGDYSIVITFTGGFV